MEAVLDAYFRDDPSWAVRHHLDSYRAFVERTIPDTLRTLNSVFSKSFDGADGGGEQRVEIEVGGPRGTDVKQMPPVHTPAECRATMASYSADLLASVTVRFFDGAGRRAKSEKRFERVRIGALPLMVRSDACPLEGATPEEMVAAGESAADVGGYFIIGGREKVIITQERMRMNALRTSRDKDGNLTGLMYAAGSEGESKLYPKRTYLAVDAARHVTLRLERFNRQPMPLHAMFRALGVESDRDILAHLCLGSDPEGAWAWMAEWARPSLSVARAGEFTQEAAFDALASRMRFRSRSEASKVIVEDLFPNQGHSFAAKAAFLAHVVRQLASADTGRTPLTDYDAYTLKRLDASGDLLGKQFRNAYRLLHIAAMGALRDEYVFGAIRTTGRFEDLVRKDNLNKIINGSIVEDYLARYMRGVVLKEGVAFDMGKSGVVQELARTNFLNTLSHLRRIHTPIDETLKLREPRSLHVTQYGVVCPFETPDGALIGLIKNLSLVARITPGVDEADVRKAMWEEGIVELEALSPGGLASATPVFLNGALVGACEDPAAIARGLRARRRRGALDRFVSVSWDLRAGELKVQCDDGRIVRPLIVNPLPDGAVAASDAIVAAAAARLSNRWQSMISGAGGADKKKGGMIEYLDVEEGFGDALVAQTPAEVGDRAHLVTHVEIHPACALGAIAALSPFLEHNYAARNLYSCGQAKQAIGVYATNFRHRVDAVAYVGWGMQLPLVTTRFRSALGPAAAKLLATGQNLVVAIAPVSGFNQEDAIVLNRASVERGALRVDVYKGVTDAEDPLKGKAFGNPVRMRQLGSYVSRLHRAYYGALDDDGFPKIGTIVGPDDRIALLGRVEGFGEGQGGLTDSTVVSDHDLHGEVDLVQASGAPGSRSVRVRLRQTRPPALGDKLATRYSQKGVVGAIVDAWQLPRTASGIVPDVFFNPHAFPSRRTVGQMLEMLTGKACALEGVFGDATAYVGTDPHEVARVLEKRGFLGNGKWGDEVMYDGVTGARLRTPVFVGVAQVCRLKLMGADKIHARASTGPRSRRTMQPAAGRAHGGGLRVGEMERDVFLSHGMSGFTRESFMTRSDGFSISVCQRCGAARDGDRPCGACIAEAGDGESGRAEAVTVEVPYAFNVLRQELDAIGISTRIMASDRRPFGGAEDDEDGGISGESGGEDENK